MAEPSHKSVNGRKESHSPCRYDFGHPAAIHVPDVVPTGPWKKAVAKWLATTIIFRALTEFSHFLLLISRLAAERIIAGRVSQE
ncbi:hypothetical protein CO669_24990 [Bradyrhizobium sp. Y36]|nr:hypothetical protein CO669_24990 [Bradyrhizobium sp. Y36]